MEEGGRRIGYSGGGSRGSPIIFFRSPFSSTFVGRRKFCCNTMVLAEAGACILENSKAKYCFNLRALLFGKFGGMGVEKVNGNDGRCKALWNHLMVWWRLHWLLLSWLIKTAHTFIWSVFFFCITQARCVLFFFLSIMQVKCYTNRCAINIRSFRFRWLDSWWFLDSE